MSIQLWKRELFRHTGEKLLPMELSTELLTFIAKQLALVNDGDLIEEEMIDVRDVMVIWIEALLRAKDARLADAYISDLPRYGPDLINELTYWTRDELASRAIGHQGQRAQLTDIFMTQFQEDGVAHSPSRARHE